MNQLQLNYILKSFFKIWFQEEIPLRKTAVNPAVNIGYWPLAVWLSRDWRLHFEILANYPRGGRYQTHNMRRGFRDYVFKFQPLNLINFRDFHTFTTCFHFLLYLRRLFEIQSHDKWILEKKLKWRRVINIGLLDPRKEIRKFNSFTLLSMKS